MNIKEALLFIKRNQIRIKLDLKNKVQQTINLISIYNMYWKCKDAGTIELLCSYCEDYKKYILKQGE